MGNEVEKLVQETDRIKKDVSEILEEERLIKLRIITLQLSQKSYDK
ncbi:MAG: hypothetical protein S4CHLAM20_04590 [Chlamydiia bacterium]|nr:hypothetical protein [Chlamydiia bacterium]